MEAQSARGAADAGVLNHLWAVYDRFLAPFELACGPGCAHCCTRNVTLTRLEARAILDHLNAAHRRNAAHRLDAAHRLNAEGSAHLMDRVAAARHLPRFVPTVTINQIAAICAAGEEPPDESADPATAPCPLLENDRCYIYPARPFACRCMVSTANCGHSGAADMPPLVVSVNTVFMQYIEHLDADGFSGNLTDMMLCMAEPSFMDEWTAGPAPLPKDLIPNRPVPALMVPPRHREAMKRILEEMRNYRDPK